MINPKRAVILFTESPAYEDRGKVKFNLRNRKRIFDIFLKNTAKVIHQAQERVSFDFIISSDPSLRKYYFRDSINLVQKGESFASRFENTLQEIFLKNYDEVIILGNDCLNINSKLIINAFDKLRENNYVVGPASDGGFYLLALKLFSHKIFQNIEWQTNSVFDQLLYNIADEGSSVKLLPILSDIDSVNDLFDWLNQCTSKLSATYFQIVKIISGSLHTLSENVFSIKSKLFAFSFWNRPPPAVCR